MNDGGPAFPLTCQGPTTAPEFYYGMTLRDYFAAKAMQALTTAIFTVGADAKIASIAPAAYEMADAMIEQRDKH